MTEVVEPSSPGSAEQVAPADTREAPATPARVAAEVIGTERFVFFSDAVVAIAITLLALDLPVPTKADNQHFLEQISDHQDTYIAFLISFIVIASYWFSHHLFFGYVFKVPPAVRNWNMLWLLTIVLTPFATRILTGEEAFEGRFIVYASIQALASIFFVLTVRAVRRAGALRADTPPMLVSDSYLRLGVAGSAFLVSIPVALVTHWAYLCWVAMLPASRLASAVRDRLVERGRRSVG